jgi:hypothetical protein
MYILGWSEDESIDIVPYALSTRSIVHVCFDMPNNGTR